MAECQPCPGGISARLEASASGRRLVVVGQQEAEEPAAASARIAMAEEGEWNKRAA